MVPEPPATLLLDFDGVLCWQLPRTCEHLHREYGVSVAPDDIDEWSWPLPGHDVHVGEVIVELMHERPRWFLGGAEPLPGVREGLEALEAAGYELHIATHRHPDTHDISRAWLERHDLPYDHFVDDVPQNKGEVPGDVLVDDYHGNVANALATGKTGVLFRQPYSEPAACEGAHVVDSWRDLRRLFDV
ncbi:5' nucleotidase, NT5C type [Halorarius litoreus]|uniref:5' nucleotidase, NT5C type n=1 Tax=Halorarius litoreus TaxID=2962676 RepID=UPI0020CF86AC|nr:hypothetical protein [Halorarius litoreus]